MRIGFDIVGARVRPDQVTEDAPVQEPMRAATRGSAGGAVQRNPSTDQLKVRRQMGRTQPAAKTACAEGDSSMSATDVHEEARLLEAMAAASTLAEQQALGARLAALRADRTAQLRTEASLDLADHEVERRFPTLATAQFTQHTAATDWLDEAVPEDHDSGEVTKEMQAAASIWWSRTVHPAVKDFPEELRAQASGMADMLAGRFGLQAQAAKRAFLDTVAHLQQRHLGSDYQPPYASSLPVGVDNPDTFDEHTLDGSENKSRADGTKPGDTPSLSEGNQPAGDSAQPVENPASGSTHDAGPGPGLRDSVDYLDGTLTSPTNSSGATFSSRRTADAAMPSSRGIAPSLEEGGPVAGDHAPTGAPVADPTTHDAGPGNGPAVDSIDHESYPWPGKSSGLRPLAVLADQIELSEARIGAQLPGPARPFLAAMRALSSVDGEFGGVPGRQVVEYFLRHSTAVRSPHTKVLLRELRAHLAPRQAGGQPPWLKNDGDGESEGGDDKGDVWQDDDGWHAKDVEGTFETRDEALAALDGDEEDEGSEEAKKEAKIAATYIPGPQLTPEMAAQVLTARSFGGQRKQPHLSDQEYLARYHFKFTDSDDYPGGRMLVGHDPGPVVTGAKEAAGSMGDWPAPGWEQQYCQGLDGAGLMTLRQAVHEIGWHDTPLAQALTAEVQRRGSNQPASAVATRQPVNAERLAAFRRTVQAGLRG